MLRSLTHFWRLHLAVLLGVAVTTAVLTGSLAVGDSLRAGLRRLWLDRLGAVSEVVSAPRLVRAGLAADLAARLGGGAQVAPALALAGSAERPAGGRRRLPRVAILGINGRFAAFYAGAERGSAAAAAAAALARLAAAPVAREGGDGAGGANGGDGAGGVAGIAVNRTLAEGLGVGVGDDVLLSWEQPSAMPREMLLAAKDPEAMLAARRFTVAAVVPDRGAGAFDLTAGQGVPANAFVPLALLQQAVGRAGSANTLLVGGLPAAGAPGAVAATLAASLHLDDAGLRLRPLGGTCGLALESDAVFLPPDAAAAGEAAAAELAAPVQPVLSDLAIEIRDRGRSVPYSMVAALDSAASGAGEPLVLTSGAPAPPLAADGMLLDSWAAEDLGAQPGDSVELTYFLPEPGGGTALRTAAARFRLQGIVALHGLAADRGLTPALPGIDQATEMASWSPPFPVDLHRVRPLDEEFWRVHGATPKAFVALAPARRRWGTRFGDLTSLRVGCPAGMPAAALAARLTPRLLERLHPASFGLAPRPVRAEGLAAAGQGTDFGALYVSFSAFLIVAAALASGQLFALGVERRAGEIGLLLALGWRRRAVKRRFLGEGLVLAGSGALLGLAGAGLVAAALLAGLRRAQGLPRLDFAASPATLAGGWLASLAAVLLLVAAGLRRLARLPAAQLLGGPPALGGAGGGARKWRLLTAVALAGLAAAAAALARAHGGAPELAFAVAACALAAGLAGFGLWCRWSGGGLGGGWLGMGLRNTAASPARSLLCMALVACAAMTLVMVAANRRGDRDDAVDAGADHRWAGWDLIAESTTPLYQDLATTAGRAALGLSAEAERELAGVAVAGMSAVPGDDASCLNLYLPRRPRLLGVSPALAAAPLPLAGGGTAAAAALFARGAAAESAAPATRAIPAIGDEQSVRWVLHKDIGDELALTGDNGEPVRLRVVGLLAGSPFQDALWIPEAERERHFARHGGRSVFLLRTPPGRRAAIASRLADELAGFGFAPQAVAARMRLYDGVEQTYLASFQALGGLGLLLGTCGLAVVLARNVVERRWELGLLRALGFRRRRLAALLVAEHGALLLLGLALGTVAGLLPQALGAGLAGPLPWRQLGTTLGGILAAGLLANSLAVALALAAPLLPVLKAER